MRINADWRQPARVAADALRWTASPMQGVERKMLERDGAEVARATSLVRYAPLSSFCAHVHALGEEFIVLDGVFSDESGDFPVGTYVRNPPGSAHTPSSGPGCVIFVKLRYMHSADTQQQVERIDPREPIAPGVRRQLLLDRTDDHVEALDLAPGAAWTAERREGEELFVIAGSISDSTGSHAARTWLRAPAGSTAIKRIAGPQGARLWRKTRYLAQH